MKNKLFILVISLLSLQSTVYAVQSEALDKALSLANVTKSQLTQLEHAIDEESGIRVHKFEFEINVRAIPLSLDDGSSGLNVIM